MGFRRVLGGGIVIASLPVLFFATALPASTVEIQTSSIGATVDTYDSCTWYITNVPGEISLGSEAKYRGVTMDVTADLPGPYLSLSGDASSAANAETSACSFYNTTMTSKMIVAEVIGVTAFEATVVGGGRDEDMDFLMDESNPLVLTVQNSEATCLAPAGGAWTLGSKSFETVGSVEVMSFAWSDPLPQDSFETGEAPRCTPSIELRIKIPGIDSAPAGAGQNYSFSGPNLTFTLSSND